MHECNVTKNIIIILVIQPTYILQVFPSQNFANYTKNLGKWTTVF